MVNEPTSSPDDPTLAQAQDTAAARPADPEAQARLARAYHRCQQLDHAEAAYRKAIALVPERPDWHNNLGNVLADAGRLREALVGYQRALELAGPDEAGEARLNHELAELELTLVVERVEYLERASELGVADAQSVCALGCGYVLAGRFHDALECLRRALELNPAHVPSATALGVVCALPFDVKDAAAGAVVQEGLAGLREAALRHPHEAMLQVHQGELLETLERSNEARVCLLRALELDPGCLEACDLASRYARLPSEASGPFEALLSAVVERSREAFGKDHASPERALALGRALLAHARFRGEEGIKAFRAASDALERAVQLLGSPGSTVQDPEFNVHRTKPPTNQSNVRNHKKLTNEPEEMARGSTSPDLALARRLLAWVLERAGSPQRALDLLEVAREQIPNEARIRLDLGGAYLRSGRIDEAFEELQAACRIDPCDAAAALALYYAFRAVRRLRVAEHRFALETTGRAAPAGAPGPAAESPDVSTGALVRLIEAQMEAMQLAPAADRCEQLLALDPAHYEGLLLSGRVAHRLGDLAGAETYFRRAIELGPGDPECHRRLGQLLAGQPGRMPEALRALGEAHRLKKE